jgi:hypothetical protein
MENAIQRFCRTGGYILRLRRTDSVVFPQWMVEGISISHLNFVVDIRGVMFGSIADYLADSKLPGDKGRSCKSGEEFEVGMIS